MFQIRHCLCPLFPALLAALLCLPTLAATTYTATISGEMRQVTVETIERGGQTYVPLSAVVEAFGGTARILPDRVHIGLGGGSAEIPGGQQQVQSSGGNFELSAPLALDPIDAYVATSDLPGLLSGVFGVAVTAPGATSAPAETPEALLEPDLVEREMELIEVEPLVPLENVQETIEEMGPLPAQERPLLPAPALSGRTIVLDPGHGGNDIGVYGPSGYQEKQLTLVVADLVRQRLEADGGFVVELTRIDDIDLSGKRRTDIANDLQASLFVSLHAGASPSDRPHGMKLFVPYGPGGPSSGRGLGRTQTLLGERVTDYSSMSHAAGQAMASVLQAQGPAEYAGMRQVPLRAAEGLTMPCVLIEIGYLTNPTEENLLRTAQYQEDIAAVLADSIRAAFSGAAAREGSR